MKEKKKEKKEERRKGNQFAYSFHVGRTRDKVEIGGMRNSRWTIQNISINTRVLSDARGTCLS